MSAASVFVKSITLPTGRTAVIGKLSWKDMKGAAKKQTTQSFEIMREMGAELVRALREDKAENDDKAMQRMEALQRKASRQPSTYDMDTCLKQGLQQLDETTVVDLPVDSPQRQAIVDGIDAPDAEALHEAIVAYAWEVPAKNESSPSTGS